jgi:hypothetical protein
VRYIADMRKVEVPFKVENIDLLGRPRYTP